MKILFLVASYKALLKFASFNIDSTLFYILINLNDAMSACVRRKSISTTKLLTPNLLKLAN